MNRPASRPDYAPRNALNADALKAAIEMRSRARHDDAPVRAWLLNHFYRHVVGNFEPARPIASLDDACRALGATPPPWGAKRFASADAGAAPVVWIDPAQPQLLALEARLVEFLTSRRGTKLDGKLDRINCPQALALWEKEHAAIAARIARGWRESRPEAWRTFLATPNGHFIEFLPDSPELRAEMAFETHEMRHCLGQFADRRALTGGYGERYADAITAGAMRLFSLRDANGQPHVTISVTVREDGAREIDQVKGKQNRPPVERYVEDVLACLNALGANGHAPADCLRLGIVHTGAGWRRIGEVDAETQLECLARHPQLIGRLAATAPAMEWLVAALDPEQFSAHPPESAPVRYAVRDVLANAAGAGPAYATEGVRWPGYAESAR